MKVLDARSVGVDSGDVSLFSDFEDGGEMWTGRGQRERRRRIAFSSPYSSVPTVHLSCSLLDADTSTTLRADVSAEAVTSDGFDVVFRTWGDTRIARVRIAWMSIGPLAGPDDWDVD